MQKIFLDANIIISFLDNSRSDSKNAQTIISHCLAHKIFLGSSEDIITTVYYVCKKHLPKEKILAFFQFFEEIGKFESFGKNVRNKSIEYCLQSKNADLEDVLQLFCAKENNYNMIISNDKEIISDIIPVQSTEEFLHTFL
jgi:predicted nucleic acid-binding protein